MIQKYQLKQLNSDEDLTKILQEILDKNPNQVAEFRAGKDKLFGFFIGQAMKATKGQANPDKLNQRLREMLNDA